MPSVPRVGHLGPFDAPRLKVMRAESHIDELSHDTQRIHELESPNPLENKAAFMYHATARFHLSMALGDAVHNLRAALDLMACDIVRLNGKSTRDVYFPFSFNAAELDKQVKEKNFDRAAPEAQDLLRNKIKPYKENGGNVALRAIHDLDVADKHRLILPTIQDMQPVIVASPFPPGSWPGTICSKCGRSYDNEPKEGTVVIEHRLFFPEESPFPRHQVVPTLKSLVHEVRGVIEAFAHLLRGRKSDP